MSPICREAPTGAIADIIDVITRVNFLGHRFNDFRVLTSQIVPFFIILSGRLALV